MFKFSNQFDIIENSQLKLLIIQKHPGDSELIPFYYYDIVRKHDSVVVGKISIRIGQNFHSYYNGHIGYEIYEKHRGNGYAGDASRMVLTVAKYHGMKSIYLTCAESNVASYKTIEKLGAQLIDICDVPKEYFGWYEDMEKQRIYRLPL